MDAAGTLAFSELRHVCHASGAYYSVSERYGDLCMKQKWILKTRRLHAHWVTKL